MAPPPARTALTRTPLLKRERGARTAERCPTSTVTPSGVPRRSRGKPRSRQRGTLIAEGHTFRAMVNTHPSSWTERYSATVGGTIVNHTGHGLQFRPLAVDEVGVWKVAGRECWEAWPLAD